MLCAENEVDQFGEVMKEYFDLGHAELVPSGKLNLHTSDLFLSTDVCCPQSSTTTKIHAVFDVSMKSASGVSR